MPLLTRTLVIVLALVIVASACGDDDPDTTTDGDDVPDTPIGSIVDREFWSTAITVGGEPATLVDGTRIRISFGPSEFAASAGCNQIGGGYTLERDAIVTGGMYMTEMGCEPALHAQDEFVIDFLGRGPTVALDGDTLTLTAPDGDTITLLDKKVAEPDRVIDENAWEVTGFFDELAAWSLGVEEPAVLDFRGGVLSGTTGCGPMPFEPSIEITESEVTITGDVGAVEWCADADELTREYAADLGRVLFESGPLTFEVDGRSLRLVGSDGTGITATVAE